MVRISKSTIKDATSERNRCECADGECEFKPHTIHEDNDSKGEENREWPDE